MSGTAQDLTDEFLKKIQMAMSGTAQDLTDEFLKKIQMAMSGTECSERKKIKNGREVYF